MLLTNLGVLICHFQVIIVSDKNFYRRLKLIAILKYKKTASNYSSGFELLTYKNLSFNTCYYLIGRGVSVT